jgi:hypothetical protein
MKILAVVFLIGLSSPALADYGNGDTTIRGIRIGFSYSSTIFPSSWKSSPISAAGKPIATDEIARSKSIMARALAKYPVNALIKDLRVVYFVKSMTFYDVGYGGTNATDALYLSNNGSSQGYTDLYLEQTFHHEYSSILYRNHPSWFNEKGWLAANNPGFDYNDPENGVGAIRKNQSSQDLDTALCNKGFLTQYSLSGIENDLNTFAQNLFSPSPGFWKIVDEYPRIARKLKLLIEFYNRLDPLFTEKYFRKLSS